MAAQSTEGPGAPGGVAAGHGGMVPPVVAILVPESNDLYRILYFVHLLSAIAAFGPLFLYPRLQRAGQIQSIATLHMRLVFPALVLLWVAGMAVSWFLIRPATTEDSERARSRLAMGVGITHVILVVSLYLMIFKPGGYEFT
jgi:hypothetical protein